MGEQTEEKIPIALRLKAWWEGYDRGELEAAFLEKYGHKAEESEEKAPEPKPTAVRKCAPIASNDRELPFDPWDEQRIEVAQYIWGDGYCGPGGPEHIVSISKLLALTPKMSLVEFGARLGGPARALTEKFGSWVSPYESSEKLVEAGNKLSSMAGLLNRAELVHYDPATISELDRKFDRAFIKDALLYIEDKQKILNLIFEYIKPEGLFLLTEITLGDESASIKPAYADWKENEPSQVYSILPDELTGMLQEAGFSVRVDEDVTASYIDLISKAWAGADAVVAKLVDQEDGPQLIETLLREAEHWSRRSNLMKSGDLQVRRLLGYKSEQKKRMLSDW